MNIFTDEIKSVIDLIKAFPTEDSCMKYLEKIRWNGVVVSPFDMSSKVYKCKGYNYRCKNTGKYFNEVKDYFKLDNVSFMKFSIDRFKCYRKIVSNGISGAENCTKYIEDNFSYCDDYLKYIEKNHLQY